jgi:hypothetical protein
MDTRHLKLPPEARAELRQRIETYELLASSATPSDAFRGADQQVAAIKAKKDDSLCWGDLAPVEVAITRRKGPETVKSSLTAWRRRMREVIGERRYGAYAADALDVTQAKPEELQDDLEQCIDTVYHFYLAYGLAARSRRRVTCELLWYSVAIVGVLVVAMLAIKRGTIDWLGAFGIPPFPVSQTAFELLLATAVAAVFGSIVSVQARLEDPKVDTDPFYRYIQTTSDRLSIAFLSPLTGAIFGMLAFGVVTAGVLKGVLDQSLLPVPDALGKGMISAQQVAALLFIGFVAGFAERLVPDTLTRIAAQALGAVSPVPPSPTVTPKIDPQGGAVHAPNGVPAGAVASSSG